MDMYGYIVDDMVWNYEFLNSKQVSTPWPHDGTSRAEVETRPRKRSDFTGIQGGVLKVMRDTIAWTQKNVQ